MDNNKTSFGIRANIRQALAGMQYKKAIVTFGLLAVTLSSAVLVLRPLYDMLRAEEVSIPEGFTALKYMQTLELADLNNDGVINLFDYAMVLDEGYGTINAFSQTDVNNDQATNAVDVSFMLDHYSTDVDEEKEMILGSPQFAQEISSEIARTNEQEIPTTDSISTFSGDTGETSREFGRTIIPTVLGTVSTYTGTSSYNIDFSVPSGPGGFKPSVGLTYSSLTVDDGRGQAVPGFPGHGFSVAGVGSIVRDTKGQKELYKIDGTIYHRFILNIPGGISAELKYNPSTGRWVSIPQSFLKIEHRPPGVATLDEGNLRYLDPWDWEVTTKDGMTYYFGEENIAEKLEDNGKIKGSEIWDKGTRLGNLYNEFDAGRLCTGRKEDNYCDRAEEDGHTVIIVTKWLLRKIKTPDGRTVDYAYDTQQKKYQSGEENETIGYITSTSYPGKITWNDAKYRVRFIKEGRKDKGRGEFMKERLKEVLVETKLERDDQYHIVRKYALGYHDAKENTQENLGERMSSEGIPTGVGIKNDSEATFLTSLQEFGTEGEGSLPAVTFRYAQFKVGDDYSAYDTYLWKINNGYGGETRYTYALYPVNLTNPENKALTRKTRARVTEKTVHDLTASQPTSGKETYTYGDVVGFLERHKQGEDEVDVAEEFLGHKSVETKQYDFDGSLLGHSESFFFQANSGNKCFEPHPGKGQSYKEIIYKGDAKDIVQQTDTRYQYRFEGKDDYNPSEGCDSNRRSQPIFLYLYDTLSYVKEEPKDFIPDIVKGKIDEKYLPKSEMRTLQRVLKFDDYGNETLSVSYGEVDSNGYDIDTTDNRYSHSYYLTDGSAWIKGLPYLSYTSNKEDCGKDDTSCQ